MCESVCVYSLPQFSMFCGVCFYSDKTNKQKKKKEGLQSRSSLEVESEAKLIRQSWMILDDSVVDVVRF